jgi:hypothetical protein
MTGSFLDERSAPAPPVSPCSGAVSIVTSATRISDTNHRPLGCVRSTPRPQSGTSESGSRILNHWGRFCGVTRSCDRGPQQHLIRGSGTGGRCLALGVYDRRSDQIRRARCVVSRDGFPQSPTADRSRFADSVSLAAGTRDTNLNSGEDRWSTRPASAFPNAWSSTLPVWRVGSDPLAYLSDFNVQNVKNAGLNWFTGFNNGVGSRSNMLPDSFSRTYTVRNAGIIRLRGLLSLPGYHLNMHAPTARRRDDYGRDSRTYEVSPPQLAASFIPPGL